MLCENSEHSATLREKHFLRARNHLRRAQTPSPAPSQTISDTLKTALTSSLTHANTASHTASHTPTRLSPLNDSPPAQSDYNP